MGRVTSVVTSIVAAGAVTLGYAVAVEPYNIEVVRVEVLCPRLPAQLDGYSILQVSDLHMRRMGRRERSIARLIESLETPDLVAVTGDMVHTQEGIEPFMELANSLRARDGVFAVFGNSEHKNGIDPRSFAAGLSSRGIVSLLNKAIRIDRGTAAYWLAGVDDPASGHDELDTALANVPADEFVLLLMHSPDPISLAVARGVDVVLSGHTHGGQVRFPLFGPALTHSWHGRRMNSGLYSGARMQKITGTRPGRTRLYVTRGLGVSGLALRFLCPPELTHITLRALDRNQCA